MPDRRKGRILTETQAANLQRYAYDAAVRLREQMKEAKSATLILKLAAEYRAQVGAWDLARLARLAHRSGGTATRNPKPTPTPPTNTRARKGISLMADPSPPRPPGIPNNEPPLSHQEAPQESHAKSHDNSGMKVSAESHDVPAEVPVKDPVDGFGEPKRVV